MKTKTTMVFTKEQAAEVFAEYLRSKGYKVDGVYFQIGDAGTEMHLYKDLKKVECEVTIDI
ncbi:MAG TPA: hypothetical protein VE710_18295 [Candidatus Bathyarchaeia archaeon]|nr:hypothetical protein [Candidatus Bathyarchaeia archaeon]